MGIKLIFSGRNESNKFVTYIIDSKDNFNEIPYIFDQGFAVNYALPYNSDYNIESICDKYILGTMPWGNLENLKMYMRECIKEVSSLCYGVNDNIFEEIIT